MAKVTHETKSTLFIYDAGITGSLYDEGMSHIREEHTGLMIACIEGTELRGLNKCDKTL